MQLTGGVPRQTINGKERRVRQEPANTVLAGVVDRCRINAGDGERGVSNEAHSDCVDLNGDERLQKKDEGESRQHSRAVLTM